MMDEFKIPIFQKVPDVTGVAGDEIIDTDHLVTIGKEPVAQMAPQKPRATGDNYCFLFIWHNYPSIRI